MTLRCSCFLNCSAAATGYSHAIRWRLLANPNTIPPKTESSLTELFDEIRATVGQEAQIVQAVFPNPSFVMQVFLQRVFAQSVIQYRLSLSCYTETVIDPATYGATAHSGQQYVGPCVFARLTVNSCSDVLTG